MKNVQRCMAAAALVFCLALTGCNGITSGGEDGYTFKFKVDNNTHQSGGTSKTITKVEFINGDTRNDTVLSWSGQTIAPGGARSMQHTVRGFTIEHTPSTRVYGVQVTFDDGTAFFKPGYAGHESKILVSVNHPTYYNPNNPSGISFSPGHW